MNNLPGQTQKPQPPKEGQSPASPPTSQPPVSQPPIVQTVQSQEPSGKKKTITKIFAALAIFLVVVLASEVAYYFFTTRRQEQEITQERANTALEKIATEPNQIAQAPSSPAPEEEDIIGATIDFERVNLILLPYEEYTKEVFQRGEIKLVNRGKVTEITTDEEERTSIRMQTTTLPTEEYGGRFSNEDIENFIVLAKNEAQDPTPIDFEDIKVGDIIKITQTFNILDKQGDDSIIIEVEKVN